MPDTGHLNSTADKPTVFYDGGCPLCLAEITTYQSAAGGANVVWVDANTCEIEEFGPGLKRSQALARLHVRRADGSLVLGAAAFVEIWSVLTHWHWLSTVARLPGVLGVLDIFYVVFLKLRRVWR